MRTWQNPALVHIKWQKKKRFTPPRNFEFGGRDDKDSGDVYCRDTEIPPAAGAATRFQHNTAATPRTRLAAKTLAKEASTPNMANMAYQKQTRSRNEPKLSKSKILFGQSFFACQAMLDSNRKLFVRTDSDRHSEILEPVDIPCLIYLSHLRYFDLI